MYGTFSPDKTVYDNYTADDPRSRRRLSLYETNIWGPAFLTERAIPLDFNVASENVSLFSQGDSQMAQSAQSQYNALDQINNGNSNANQISSFLQSQNLAQNQDQNQDQNQNQNQNQNQRIYASGMLNMNASSSSQWSPSRRMLDIITTSSLHSRLFSVDGYARKASNQGKNYLPMLQGKSHGYPQQNMAPNVWNDSPWRTAFPVEVKENFVSELTPFEPLTGVAPVQNMSSATAPLLAPPNIAPEQSLSNSFMHGVNLNPPYLQSSLLRRHSYGEGIGFRSQTDASTYQKSPRLGSQALQDYDDPQTIAAVHEYFSADPHERVKVTTEYLEQRFFDEEKYLGDLYQLPKFPVENLLRNYLLVLVGFKAGRIDVFCMPDNVKELKSLKVGDLVIVEADRGRDLGKVVKMNISIDEARLLKLLQFLEQQAAISDHMTVNDLSVKSLQNTGGNHHGHHGANSPPTLHFPKSILSLAQPNEILQILNKKQDEEKACRLCLAKIASTTNMLSSGDTQSTLTSSDLMQMNLIDAEYQFDRRKLIFYYSTSKRIDFRDLVRELFRIYKTRIWMCAVNGIPYVPQHQKSKGSKIAAPSRNGNHTGSSHKAGANGAKGGSSGAGTVTEANGANMNIGTTHAVAQSQATQSTGQSSIGGQQGSGMIVERRFSYSSGIPVYNRRLQSDFVLEFGVPRNYREGGRLEEESISHPDNSESLVLKSLVDTLNH